MGNYFGSRWLIATLIAATFILSACQVAAPTAPPVASPTQTAVPIEPAVAPTATDIPSATATATLPAPTSTAAPAIIPPTRTATLPPAVTPKPGMVLYTHPRYPYHVFQVDPAEWMLDPYLYGDPASNFLRHRTLTNCRIGYGGGMDGGPDMHTVTVNKGIYTWEVNFYAPEIPSQLAVSSGLILRLYSYTKNDCRNAIDKVLENLIYENGILHNPNYAAYQTPAPRSTPDGFNCDNGNPAYFKQGDQVRIITDAVWLRSAPNQDESSKLTRLPKDKDWQIEITGGPACYMDPQYSNLSKIFWQVRVSLPGKPEQTGWLAQGDWIEPYLVLFGE